ncbi:MAG: DUF2141 domain-containing protein [Syntrophaceae bacterium]|nr:DUF2141 domain-containing protein [Syntrophaceae bacterium]
MKRAVIFILGVWVLSLLTMTALSQERPESDTKTGTLIVSIGGFEDDRGDARAELCKSPEEYKGERETFRRTVLPIKNGKVEWVLKDLPWGKYAVKAYHDKNANSILDKNAMGLPKEPYGFSNNARGFFGLPDYETVAFKFDQAVMTVPITVK